MRKVANILLLILIFLVFNSLAFAIDDIVDKDNLHNLIEGVTSSRGSKELIQKIQEYYNKMGLHYEEDEIVITAGGSEAVLFSLFAIFDEGVSISGCPILRW